MISVIIPTKDRPQELLKCLDAISKQNAEQEKYEIIIVNDGSKSDYLAVEEMSNKISNCSYYYRKISNGAASARNFGVKKAKGLLLAFTDDDCKPNEDWINCIHSYFSIKEHNNVIAVGGSVKPMCINGHMINGYLSFIKFLDGPLLQDGVIANMATANLTIRRKYFELIGGFDERFKYSEDQNLVYRLSRIGTLDFDVKIEVCHNNDIKFRQFYRKYINYGMGVCQHLYSSNINMACGDIYSVYCYKVSDIIFNMIKIITKETNRVTQQENYQALRIREKIIYRLLSFIQEVCFQYGAVKMIKIGGYIIKDGQ